MLRTATPFALPLVALAAVLAALVLFDPVKRLTPDAPPVELVGFERVVMEPGRIRLRVRADGSGPVSIAQVQVDGAFWAFRQTPPGPLARLRSAEIAIAYPWVSGETHHITLVTATGVTFKHTVDVAQQRPSLFGEEAATIVLVGLLLGLAPVSIGLMSFPGLRRLGAPAMGFALAVTVGLLAYLLVDTLGEGLEIARKALGRYRAATLVWVLALVTAALLIALGRARAGPPRGLVLAGFIALGIGLHNLGEGLVVGAALATGKAALAAFLVFGFVIHNVTEGFGIAAPLVEARPRLRSFAGLALLAGLPALLGVALGAQAVSPLWTTVCFAVGAGAIVQVIFELSVILAARMRRAELAATPVLSGFVAGLFLMYATALLV